MYLLPLLLAAITGVVVAQQCPGTPENGTFCVSSHGPASPLLVPLQTVTAAGGAGLVDALRLDYRPCGAGGDWVLAQPPGGVGYVVQGNAQRFRRNATRVAYVGSGGVSFLGSLPHTVWDLGSGAVYLCANGTQPPADLNNSHAEYGAACTGFEASCAGAVQPVAPTANSSQSRLLRGGPYLAQRDWCTADGCQAALFTQADVADHYACGALGGDVWGLSSPDQSLVNQSCGPDPLSSPPVGATCAAAAAPWQGTTVLQPGYTVLCDAGYALAATVDGRNLTSPWMSSSVWLSGGAPLGRGGEALVAVGLSGGGRTPAWDAHPVSRVRVAWARGLEGLPWAWADLQLNATYPSMTAALLRGQLASCSASSTAWSSMHRSAVGAAALTGYWGGVACGGPPVSPPPTIGISFSDTSFNYSLGLGLNGTLAAGMFVGGWADPFYAMVFVGAEEPLPPPSPPPVPLVTPPPPPALAPSRFASTSTPQSPRPCANQTPLGHTVVGVVADPMGGEWFSVGSYTADNSGPVLRLVQRPACSSTGENLCGKTP